MACEKPGDTVPGLEGAVGAASARRKDSSGGSCSIRPFEGNVTRCSGAVSPCGESHVSALDSD